MKNYVDVNGNPIGFEMTPEKMVEIAIRNTEWKIKNGLITDKTLIKLVKEARKNQKEIVRTIKTSDSHKLAKKTDAPEIHFIILVEGKAVCAKSMVCGLSYEDGMDSIHFVYEKTYNRFTYDDFQKEALTGEGLDTFYANFNYKVEKAA